MPFSSTILTASGGGGVRYRILGAWVDAVTVDELTGWVEDAVRMGKKTIVANHNLHSLYLFHKHERMRSFYKISDLVHIDGMGIVVLARILGHPISRSHRVAYLDWLDTLMSVAAKHKWRIFFLGGAPGVGERAAFVIQRRYPGIEMECHHGFFDATPGSRENQEVLRAIGTYRPHLLLVGMGMPRQEIWIYDNYDQLPNCVILNCGAFMDYIAGVVPTPPRWMGRIGFEWLFRLLCEPRRLWKRYLLEPWFILWLILVYVFARRSERAV